MSEVIEIDGSMLEGGGQILRMALTLGALLKKSVKIFNIRAGRSKPGLMPQHLSGVNLVGDITSGQLQGNVKGSTELTFSPGKISGGKFLADPGTAGSITLLLQVSLPCLLFADKPSELHLKGGTNVDFAPQIDHTLMVFKPIVERMGAKFTCDVIKRGYYPKGGGEVKITVEPCHSLQPIDMTNRGKLTRIEGKSFVAGVLPLKVSHGMADAASRLLRDACPEVPLKIERCQEPPHLAQGNGNGIILVAKSETGCLIGGSCLGKRGVPAAEVGENAAKELLDVFQSNSCVDNYLQDQLVIFMALASGKSRVRIGEPTMHTKTAIFVAELLSKAKFAITQDEVSTILECEGIGLQR